MVALMWKAIRSSSEFSPTNTIFGGMDMHNMRLETR
jgi:hypothetical protein